MKNEKSTVHILLKKYGIRKRTESITDQVGLVEQKFGFCLPRDYIEFASNYFGFEKFIGEEFLRLWNLEELIQMNIDYEITTELDNTIGIGTNGASEFIAIEKIAKENFRVVLSPFIDLNKECHIDIGSSFTNFLLRLNHGKEWFE